MDVVDGQAATILWVTPTDADLGSASSLTIRHLWASSLEQARALVASRFVDILVCAPELTDGSADELFEHTKLWQPETARILVVEDDTLPVWRSRGCHLASAIISTTGARGVAMLARWMVRRGKTARRSSPHDVV